MPAENSVFGLLTGSIPIRSSQFNIVEQIAGDVSPVKSSTLFQNLTTREGDFATNTILEYHSYLRASTGFIFEAFRAGPAPHESQRMQIGINFGISIHI